MGQTQMHFPRGRGSHLVLKRSNCFHLLSGVEWLPFLTLTGLELGEASLTWVDLEIWLRSQWGREASPLVPL